MSKRSLTDWTLEYARIREEKYQWRERFYNEVISQIPSEIWTLIVKFSYPKLPRCQFAGQKEAYSRTVFGRLVLVSKTFYNTIKTSIEELFVSTLKLEKLELSLYPNIKRVILWNSHFSGKFRLPASREIEELVIGGMLDVTEETLSSLNRVDHPNLKRLTFVSHINFNEVNGYVLEIEKMITRVKHNGFLDGVRMDPFLSLKRLSCTGFTQVDCDFSQLNYIKVKNLYQGNILKSFSGILSYQGIQHQVENGFIVKPNGERELLNVNDF